MSSRQLAADRASRLIHEAEQAMDVAMARASALVTELPSLQIEAGLHASWAQPAVASVCSALGDMTSARGAILDAHKSLAAIQRRLGIVRLEGPNNPKEDDEIHGRPVRGANERVVALRA